MAAHVQTWGDLQVTGGQISDTFDDHPAVLSILDDDDPRRAAAAIGLWTLCLSWTQAETGRYNRGQVPPELPARFFGPAGLVGAGVLVGAGMWEPLPGGGWQILGDGELFLWGSLPDTRNAIPTAVRLAVYERDNWACRECASTADLTLDHIWPWSLGGTDTEDNLQTLCRSCNSRKGARV